MLYQRMITARLAQTTALVLLVVMILAVAIQLPHVMLRFLTMGIPPRYLLIFLALFLLSYSDFLVLVSVYCAVLWVMLTVFRDGDAYALFNFGIGMSHLLRLVCWFVLPFVVLMVVLAGYVSPQAFLDMARVESHLIAGHAVARLKPGIFHEFGHDRKLSYFVPDPTQKTPQSDAFLHMIDPHKEEVVYAKKVQAVQEGHDYAFHCDQGLFTVHVADQGITDWVLSFDSLVFRIPLDVSARWTIRPEALSSGQLWRRYLPDDRALLMSRLSRPFMLLVLSLMAVPLSYLRPRSPHFALKLFMGIVLLVIYMSGVYMMRRLIVMDHVSLGWGFLILHGIAVCCLMGAVAYRSFFYQRFKKRLSLLF